jgi:hypothetical protein
MTTAEAICTGTCNSTPQSLVQGKVKPDTLYFLNPATGEILECPADSVAAFRKEAEFLNKLLDDLLLNEQRVFDATLTLHTVQASVDPTKTLEAQKALDRAVAAETKAREVMFKELKDLPKFNDGASGLLELLPLATYKGQTLSKTRRVTYVRSEKVKNHKRVYHNLPGDVTKLKAFYTKDKGGAYKLDPKKLGDALRKVPVKG